MQRCQLRFIAVNVRCVTWEWSGYAIGVKWLPFQNGTNGYHFYHWPLYYNDKWYYLKTLDTNISMSNQLKPSTMPHFNLSLIKHITPHGFEVKRRKLAECWKSNTNVRWGQCWWGWCWAWAKYLLIVLREKCLTQMIIGGTTRVGFFQKVTNTSNRWLIVSQGVLKYSR